MVIRALNLVMDNADSMRALTKGQSSEVLDFAHTTTYRGVHLDIQIHSHAVKTVHHESGINHVLPVFGEEDKVVGHVTLDSSCSQGGQLSIVVEGSFIHVFPKIQPSHVSMKRKHTFFSSSKAFPIPAVRAPSPRSVFHNTNRRQQPRTFPFQFNLPAHRPGQEMPQSFSSSTLGETAPRGRAFVEKAVIAYKVMAIWQPSQTSEQPARLDAPFIFQHSDFQSLGRMTMEPFSWLEMPLRSDRPLGFHCAVTLPSSTSFSRTASLPYFVVFTTTPHSPELIREIAYDATIAVSLVRRITYNAAPPPRSPRSSASDPGHSSGRSSPTARFVKRVVGSSSQALLRTRRSADELRSMAFRTKALPELPPESQESITQSRTMYASLNLGFPKRPKFPSGDSRRRQKMKDMLPDGLFKASIQLNKSMLPTIDWDGISVEYFLEVSVLVGQDDSRACIPVRIL